MKKNFISLLLDLNDKLVRSWNMLSVCVCMCVYVCTQSHDPTHSRTLWWWWGATVWHINVHYSLCVQGNMSGQCQTHTGDLLITAVWCTWTPKLPPHIMFLFLKKLLIIHENSMLICELQLKKDNGAIDWPTQPDPNLQTQSSLRTDHWTKQNGLIYQVDPHKAD